MPARGLNVSTNAGKQTKATINAQEWLKLLSSGQFDPLCRQMLAGRSMFWQPRLMPSQRRRQQSLDLITNLVLFIFTQPDFRVPEKYTRTFVLFNRTISNLVSISCFENTDAYLKILRDQTSNFVQVLTLFSARNTVKFDRKVLFDLQPELASLWYLEYGSIFYSAVCDKTVQDNLQEHFQFQSSGIVHSAGCAGSFLWVDVPWMGSA